MSVTLFEEVREKFRKKGPWVYCQAIVNNKKLPKKIITLIKKVMAKELKAT